MLANFSFGPLVTEVQLTLKDFIQIKKARPGRKILFTSLASISNSFLSPSQQCTH